MTADQGANFQPTRRSWLAGACAAGVTLALRPTRALAAWPSDKAIRIFVSNSPGGPSDIMARFLADGLKQELGGTFIVENRTGGGGIIGITSVSRAAPDGYTLYLATSTWVIAPAIQPNPGYDPIKDLVPVAELATSPTVFVVRSDLGVKSLKEAVELARKDQDKFSIAVPPIGTALSMAAAYLKVTEDLPKVALVVHTGGGQAIQSLLTGSVQMCSSSLAPALPLIQDGTLRPLAILSDGRWPTLPDLPTAAEAGWHNANFETYTALMAPPKTPPEILTKLEQAAIAFLKRPDYAERIRNAGFFVTAGSAAEYRARIAKELPFFRDIADRANIKIQ